MTEDANGNSVTFPSIPGTDNQPTERASIVSPPPFHSDLVTESKLLTREEECTLKTALAFVIIKARAKARANETISRRSILPNASEKNLFKKRGFTESSIATKNGTTTNEYDRDIASLSPWCPALENDSSILDHLFSHCSSRNSSSRNHTGLRYSQPSRFLECTKGRDHIDHMFCAAKTLAETWLVRHRNQQLQLQHRDESQVLTHAVLATMTATKMALLGATGHLARQLQLLLVANQTIDSMENKSTPSKPSSITKSLQAKRKGRDKRMSKVRYRRPSMSSKSATESASAPSSPSRTDTATSPVNAATGNSNNSKTDDIIENEMNRDSMEIESVLDIQKWIRSTLLHLGDYKQHSATTDTTNIESKFTTTILSCRNATIYDVLASFHVYAVMVPQISRISPPLIGHIFQVVAKLVRDLYNDKIAVIGEAASIFSGTSGGEIPVNTCDNIARQLLDHLATSALMLLEICWNTKIGSDREHHRSFLLLSLQEILGDLLIPLPRSNLAREHYRLTISASRNRMFQKGQQHSQGNSSRSLSPKKDIQVQQQRRLILPGRNKYDSMASAQGLAFRKARDGPSTSAGASVTPTHDGTRVEKATPSKSQASRRSPPSFQMNALTNGCFLDPEAKLLLRMGVYRLILMENRI